MVQMIPVDKRIFLLEIGKAKHKSEESTVREFLKEKNLRGIYQRMVNRGMPNNISVKAVERLKDAGVELGFLNEEDRLLFE